MHGSTTESYKKKVGKLIWDDQSGKLRHVMGTEEVLLK